MKHMTLEELHAAFAAQKVSGKEHLAFVCPMCATVQSARDLINAGAGNTLSDVEKYLGFSCVGRFTGAASPRKKPDGRPCNWTLGGLLNLHELEVTTPDGVVHKSFDVATPEQAQAHEENHSVAA